MTSGGGKGANQNKRVTRPHPTESDASSGKREEKKTRGEGIKKQYSALQGGGPKRLGKKSSRLKREKKRGGNEKKMLLDDRASTNAFDGGEGERKKPEKKGS